MIVATAQNWTEYELLDSGAGQRLERFGPPAGGYTLVRPDPQCIWRPHLPESQWQKADAVFQSNKGERGQWQMNKKVSEKWIVSYQNIKFYCKLTPFKHTGVFPEQAVHWDFISSKIANNKTIQPSNNPPHILNLFAYTGISSLVAAKAGAKVTHVDSSYPTIGWAKQNQQASKLPADSIRWMLDDVLKFCQREIKRGVKYDGIIMDPPSYGHGPSGEVWDFNKDFPKLMALVPQLLTPTPLFVIANAYAISASSLMLENVFKDYLGHLGGKIESGELALKESGSDRLLSTGIFARLVFD